jgi:hypothetical protein
VSGYFDPLRPSRARYLLRSARALASNPGEGVEKVLEKLARRREIAAEGREAPPPELYPPTEDWEERLHSWLDAGWPCPRRDEFDADWQGTAATMAERGLRMGRQNYGGDDDGDSGFVRAIWCIARHRQPRAVVETGVGHGVTSRAVLDALERNGEGALWSIDLPPLTITARSKEIAAAVPAASRGRWTYLEGSSRRRLPALIAELGTIDLFVHDSRHSTRNVLFECERAYAALRPGGFLVVDDLDGNWGFARFGERAPGARTLIGTADDGQRRFGIAMKPAERSL